MKSRIWLLSFLLLIFSGRARALEAGPQSFSQDQLQDLVAPIALYPDPLLAQVLPASTYPLEIVEAARLIHKKKDFSKIDAQSWDPSVKAVAHYPEILKMMSERLDWTQQLGQAVLAQQSEVLQAVQERRRQAERIGNLKTTRQQIVQQTDNIVEIIPADPEVVYVPAYNPTIVYTAPAVDVIHFGPAFVLGSWFFTGFFWPHYSLVCNDHPFYWGRGWDRSYYSHGGYRGTNINNTYNTTTVYNNVNVNRPVNVTQNNVFQRPWMHDSHHGNPYNGRPSYGDVAANRPYFPKAIFPARFQQPNHDGSWKDRGYRPSSTVNNQPPKWNDMNKVHQNFDRGWHRVDERAQNVAEIPRHSSPVPDFRNNDKPTFHPVDRQAAWNGSNRHSSESPPSVRPATSTSFHPAANSGFRMASGHADHGEGGRSGRKGK